MKRLLQVNHVNRLASWGELPIIHSQMETEGERHFYQRLERLRQEFSHESPDSWKSISFVSNERTIIHLWYQLLKQAGVARPLDERIMKVLFMPALPPELANTAYSWGNALHVCYDEYRYALRGNELFLCQRLTQWHGNERETYFPLVPEDIAAFHAWYHVFRQHNLINEDDERLMTFLDSVEQGTAPSEPVIEPAAAKTFKAIFEVEIAAGSKEEALQQVIENWESVRQGLKVRIEKK